MIWLLRLCLAAFSLHLAIWPLAAQERSSALAELLRRSPADLLHGPDYPFVLFADPWAAQAVLPGKSAVEALDLPAFRDVLAAGLGGQWQPLTGFSPGDLGPILSVEAPPRRVLMFRLPEEVAKGVGPALLASGYGLQDQVYARGDEDFALDLMAADPADPFGHGMGLSSRVAIEGGLVLQAPSWADLGAMRTLASAPPDPMLAPLLAALDDRDLGRSRLLQAHLLLPGWPPALPGQGRLPPWTSGLMAELSDGLQRITLIILAFPGRAMAEISAGQIAEDWDSLPLETEAVTMAQLTQASPVIIVEGDGPAVTVVALSRPEGSALPRIFAQLLQAEFRRELAILAPK